MLKKIFTAVQKYAINTIFDSVNTLMGIILGVFFSETGTPYLIAISAISTAVALGISSGTSCLEAERLEQLAALKEIEQAMLQKFPESKMRKEARNIYLFVGLFNFLIPVTLAMVVILIVFLVPTLLVGVIVILSVLLAILFASGVLFGRMNDIAPVKYGLRMFLVGFTTFLVVTALGQLT